MYERNRHRHFIQVRVLVNRIQSGEKHKCDCLLGCFVLCLQLPKLVQVYAEKGGTAPC